MKELLQKKTTKIGIAVIILIVVIGIMSINVRSAQRQREYDGHVEAAEKYLTELDYEQAIAEYTLALEIEPNNEEVLNALEQTYLDYAQSLADAGEYDKAVSVLEEGYAQIGRESLREKIDDVRSQQAQREAEEAARIEEEKRIKEEEEKKKQELIELVESNEFYDESKNMYIMLQNTYLQPYRSGLGVGVSFLTNAQMEELCKHYINILESYKSYYGEDWYNHYVRYDDELLLLLSELYFAVGEYESCVEIRNQLYEINPDGELLGKPYFSKVEARADITHEYELDEYGRMIYKKSTTSNYESETIFEYGEYNRPVKITIENNYNDGDKYLEVNEFEYDSEGRLVEVHWIIDGNVIVNHDCTMSYTYTESGLTMKYREEVRYGRGTSSKSYSQDYEIDEFGRIEPVGESYDKIYKNV